MVLEEGRTEERGAVKAPAWIARKVAARAAAPCPTPTRSVAAAHRNDPSSCRPPPLERHKRVARNKRVGGIRGSGE